MNKGLVSIIMPVYNAEKHVKKSIESVLNQTYNKFEFLIINDGSTDNTLTILNSFEDSRIKVFTIKNGGPSPARNFGLKVAIGEYIQFVDADDALEQDAVEQLVSKIEKTDLVIGSYQVVKNGKIIKKVQPIGTGVFSQKYITDNYINMFKSQVIRHLWNKLYRKEILDNFHLTFDERIKRGEGIFFNIEYLKHIEQAYLTDKVLYNYYDIEDSITSSYVPDFVKDTDMIFSEVERFLTDHSVKTEDIKELDCLYAYRLMSYVTVLFNNQDKLSADDIKSEIKIINTNQKFRRALTQYEPTSGKMKLLKLLFRLQMNRAIYTVYSLNSKKKLG